MGTSVFPTFKITFCANWSKLIIRGVSRIGAILLTAVRMVEYKRKTFKIVTKPVAARKCDKLGRRQLGKCDADCTQEMWLGTSEKGHQLVCAHLIVHTGGPTAPSCTIWLCAHLPKYKLKVKLLRSKHPNILVWNNSVSRKWEPRSSF